MTHSFNPKTHRRAPSRRTQSGVVLYFALVVVVAMMLVGVAMLRSVGSGVGVAGNLAFKQNATMAGERGAEKAINYLLHPTATLDQDKTDHGYYATWHSADFDPMTFDWQSLDSSNNVITDVTSGNEIRWVMHRLCKVVGSSQTAAGQECSRQGVTVIDPVSGLPIGQPPRPLYRVTSRVQGPRNAVSYVQIMVY